MRGFSKNIGIALLIILILPAIFYSAYEISALNENEAMIEDFYENQLQIIIFSVSQFSE